MRNDVIHFKLDSAADLCFELNLFSDGTAEAEILDHMAETVRCVFSAPFGTDKVKNLAERIWNAIGELPPIHVQGCDHTRIVVWLKGNKRSIDYGDYAPSKVLEVLSKELLDACNAILRDVAPRSLRKR